MSPHSQLAASRRSPGTLLRLLTVTALMAVPLIAGVASSGASPVAHASTARPCMAVAKGAPWSSKGQKGTLYTVLGVNGASCSLGAKWLKRITSRHGMFSGPPGWTCIVLPGVGECQVKGGGIFEFLPKLKK
jgi:hypothetical protein